jgi:hypothetical protein
MELVDVNVKKEPCLFATRHILAGEEIAYDYGCGNLWWRTKVDFWIFHIWMPEWEARHLSWFD